MISQYDFMFMPIKDRLTDFSIKLNVESLQNLSSPFVKRRIKGG
jgi:hypothetical protein